LTIIGLIDNKTGLLQSFDGEEAIFIVFDYKNAHYSFT
jgi:hypothetical protein